MKNLKEKVNKYFRETSQEEFDKLWDSLEYLDDSNGVMLSDIII